MSRPVKCNKVSEVEVRESMDRISSLPDDLLGYMLSFLPTKWAVGTSVLSSRWRCLHMLTNCLSFDASCRSQKMDSKAKETFKKFVNRVLMLHKVSPIKKFNLDCGRHIYDYLDLHTWISAAILKGVEQLHLRFNGSVNALPRCLFSCQNILELKLSSIKDFQVPESIYLPNLKTLYLHSIEFSDTDSFHKLFSACSLLQELEVTHCEWPANDTYCHLRLSSRELNRLTLDYCDDHFEVDAPNLAYLQYRVASEHVALSLKNADRLVTAILDFYFEYNSNSFQLVALALIKAVCHVKELQLLGEAQEYLTCFVDDRIPSYPNMVNLHLGYCTDYTWEYITHLLANSPQLDTLIFNEKLISLSSMEEEWPLDVALAPFSSRVKVIEAFGFSGHKSELILLKYLLGNAEALQRLNLYKDRFKMSKEQEFQTLKELLTFPRASRTCAVHLMD